MRLCAPIDTHEFREVVFGAREWKALGPDGFPIGFNQGDWSLMNDSMCDFAHAMWDNPKTIEEIYHTDICLIPKVEKFEFVNQFRPISLSNIIYKMLMKITVNRLKPIIAIIVSPYQTNFVSGRNIYENIVIAQQVLHSMEKRKSNIMIICYQNRYR